MGWMPLAEVIRGRWQPGIGDPTFMGWLTVVAYLLAAAACARAAWREPPHDRRKRTKPSRFWLATAVLMALLGINKQLDLQTLFTQIGRDILEANGLYEKRRQYQAFFLGGVVVSSIALLAGSLWLARRSLRTRWPALIGMAFVLGFVVIRAASFHHFDAFLASKLGGLKWNWILELGGILIVAVGALLVRRLEAARTTRFAKEAALLNYLYRSR